METVECCMCNRGLSPGGGAGVLRLARSPATPISVQGVQSAGCKHNIRIIFTFGEMNIYIVRSHEYQN